MKHKKPFHYTTIGVIFSTSIVLTLLYFYAHLYFALVFPNHRQIKYLTEGFIQCIPYTFPVFIVTILLLIIIPIITGYILDYLKNSSSS